MWPLTFLANISFGTKTQKSVLLCTTIQFDDRNRRLLGRNLWKNTKIFLTFQSFTLNQVQVISLLQNSTLKTTAKTLEVSAINVKYESSHSRWFLTIFYRRKCCEKGKITFFYQYFSFSYLVIWLSISHWRLPACTEWTKPVFEMSYSNGPLKKNIFKVIPGIT